MNLLLHLLGADSGQLSPEQLQYILAASTTDSASSASSASTGESGLPHFAVFGPKGGRASGNQSSNASADAASTPSTRSTIAELVVVPLSGTARPPASHHSSRDDTLSANLKWWGMTISLAFVGMLLGAVAVAVVRRWVRPVRLTLLWFNILLYWFLYQTESQLILCSCLALPGCGWVAGCCMATARHFGCYLQDSCLLYAPVHGVLLFLSIYREEASGAWLSCCQWHTGRTIITTAAPTYCPHMLLLLFSQVFNIPAGQR